MNINRHNYEEYFILYMDNELSGEERGQVEYFVSQHPDLKEELDTLMQFKLEPDASILFPVKEELWKGESSVHSGNHTDWLLLYIDNELNAEERILVDNYLETEPSAQKELELLGKAKFTPEQVEFTDKASLYRREERRIPFIWMRIAAALILAAIGITILLVMNKKNGSAVAPIANIQPGGDNKGKQKQELNNTIKEEGIAKEIAAPTVNKELDETTAREEKRSPALTTAKDNIASNNNIYKTSSKEELVQPVIKKEDAIASNEIRPSNNLPLPVSNPHVSIEEKAIASNNIKDELKDDNKILKNKDVTSRTDPASDIKTAAYIPTDDGFGDNGNDGKKNKLRGFFRKVSRTFEKRTKIDPANDDKLLVAGFSINLK